MNTISLYNLLISMPARGFLWALFLFTFCFFGIHILKLAQIGWGKLRTEKPPPAPEEKKEEKKTPAPPQEPVYYIVERKTRRTKSTYGEPKEIRFK